MFKVLHFRADALPLAIWRTVSVCFWRTFLTQSKLFDTINVRRRPLPVLQPADPVVSILCSRRFTEARDQKTQPLIF